MDTDQVTVKNPIVEKQLVYNTGSDYVKWEVPINSNRVLLTNATITDTLQPRLMLDTDSVQLYNVNNGNNSGKLPQTGYRVDTTILILAGGLLI